MRIGTPPFGSCDTYAKLSNGTPPFEVGKRSFVITKSCRLGFGIAATTEERQYLTRKPLDQCNVIEGQLCEVCDPKAARELTTQFQPYRQQIDVANSGQSGHDNVAAFKCSS